MALFKRLHPDKVSLDVFDERFLPAGMGSYENLVDFLTAGTWEDGTPRQQGTFMVFCDGGRLKVMLNDKAQGLVAFVTLIGGESVLEQVEAAITSASTDWRVSRDKPAVRK